MSITTGAYAGDLDVMDVWQALKTDPAAVLIDVRTELEWRTIGAPDLASLGKDVLFIEWQRAPSMAVNPDFVKDIDAELRSRGASRDAPLFFLCRSGARSLSAANAVAAVGYTQAHNIAGGFEGPPGPDGRRGTVAGWQAAELPWMRP
jgi:rhodanese-related sulfurtransferase